MKKQRGITLIALVITIIILIILAGISINILIGDEGIITRATNAAEEMKIAEGKEKIELKLLDMLADRASNGKSCDLDYISENIDGKIKDVKLESVKGNPVEKIYLSYKDIMYKVTEDLKVVVVGNINVEGDPTIEIIRDTTQTGVDQVTLTVKASVEEGEISEIIKPDGSIAYVDELIYTVAENGNYTFKAVTEKGISEEKTVNIQSINIKDAIELADSSGDAALTCSHIYETKYDETNHWKQCILCNNKIDSVSHNIVIEGTETCSESYAAQVKYCTDVCGYKITIPKPSHTIDKTINPVSVSYDNIHIRKCTVCSKTIEHINCTNEKGERLGCATGIAGTCTICGKVRNTEHMQIINGKCRACGKEFYTYNLRYEALNKTQIKFNCKCVPIDSNIDISTDKVQIAQMINYQLIDTQYFKNDDGSIEFETILDISKVTEAAQYLIRFYVIATEGEKTYSGYLYKGINPDLVAPTVKSITVEGTDSLDEFSRSATITAKFEEGWDSIVEMALFDENGNVISNWSLASKDGTTFTKEFNVIAETTTSKELTVKAKDRCGNIGEGKVTIGKIDTKAPTLVSSKQYNDKWKISLPIKVEATDEGSGNVQIGLGSESDYKLASKEAEKYYRNYHFVGDIYEDIVRIVYLKDAVGNVTTNRITIGKLDRTSPTITNINQDGKNIVIEANDINTKLNKEGSKISGYAISKSREVPTDNRFQSSNTFIVEDAGTYYIWAKDNAGNLSETKIIEVN